MNTYAIFTTETEHTGDLARYAERLAEFPRTRVLSQEMLRDERECGLIRIETGMSREALQDCLDADCYLEGFAQIVRR